MSEITTTTASKNELIIKDSDLNTVEELLTEGLTLTEIFSEKKVLPCNLHKFYNYLKKPENKAINDRIVQARIQGCQTLVDKLLQIYNTNLNDINLDPSIIVWTRDRAAMVKWVASKLTDIYSDKKDLTLNKTVNNSISVSWLDSPQIAEKFQEYEKIANEKDLIEVK